MKKLLLVIMVMVVFSSLIKAQVIASDNANNASYSDGWQNGESGGTGFGNWDLWRIYNNNEAGHYIGSSATNFADIDVSGKSFYIFGYWNNYAYAQRLFNSALSDGQTFKITLTTNNYTKGLKGISLKSSTYATLFELQIGASKYAVNGTDLGWLYDSRSKFVIEVTQGNGKYFVKIVRGTDVYGPTQFNSSVEVAGFLLYCGGTDGNDPGDEYRLYFNSMEIRTDSPVPVELSSFTASIQNKAVVLNWATATEINNYGFEVERSFDKTNWNKVAFKNGYGNSNSVKDYSFTDKDITKNGMYYYRLKQIDNNGDFEYSDIVEVNVNIPVKFEVAQNYPNPFNPVTNISFTLPEANNVTLYIFNAIGQQIKAINAGYKEAGKHTIEFDGSSLNSGVYFYKVEAGNNSMIRKMALIK
jgi:hypothetical protein